MFKHILHKLFDILFWVFIRFCKTKFEDHQEYVIYYKELWGYRQIIEIKPRYF
jgi:hypothetical protein